MRSPSAVYRSHSVPVPSEYSDELYSTAAIVISPNRHRKVPIGQPGLSAPIVVAERCGHDTAVLWSNYAKMTKSANTSAADVIGALTKGALA